MAVDVEGLRRAWVRGVCLDPEKEVAANFLDELERYSRLPRREVEDLFYRGTEVFAKEWDEQYKTDPNARVTFYDEALTHIFFVMHNSALRMDLSSPLLYVFAAEWAKRLKAARCLDYGAGTGSGAMFFAKAGIETTLADISSRMLDFAKWRFAQRNLTARFLDVKQAPLPCEAFDLITCFHVLQHVEDPINLLRTLRNALKPGGVLLVNGSLKKDPNRPMQPDHGGLKTRRRYRAVGFQTLWGPTQALHRLSRTSAVALQKVERPAVINAAYGFYDTILTDPRLRRALYLAGTPVRRFLPSRNAHLEEVMS